MDKSLLRMPTMLSLGRTSMNIGLKQVDGKWPNLALMKISAWHKQQGDNVELFSQSLWGYDKVYASKIFSFSQDDEQLPFGTVRGGTGYGMFDALPEEIENSFPDYSLYRSNEYAMGFTTRGCIRECEFCMVPRKEGRLHVVGDIYAFWDGQKRLRLLDNNLTAAPIAHFEKIMEQIRQHGIIVDISQGLDARIIRREHCLSLKGIKIEKQLRFAWDSMDQEEQILHGLNLVFEYFKPYRVMVFVLIGYNTTPEEDLYRVEKLFTMKCDPFVMPFNKNDIYQQRFTRWVNHKAIFKSVQWADYK